MPARAPERPLVPAFAPLLALFALFALFVLPACRAASSRAARASAAPSPHASPATPAAAAVSLAEDRCDPAPSCPGIPPETPVDALPAWAHIRALLRRPPEQLDVAELNLWISHARDPRVDVAANLRRIDELAAAVRRTFPPRCDHRCRIDALNRYLFHTVGFRSEFDPSGMYREVDRDLLDRVLDTHVGYCEGLSLLYLALGRRLEVPLAAVAGRQHMYVRYVGTQAAPFDIDTTEEGRPPAPDTSTCHAAAGVFGASMAPRVLAGNVLGVVGIAAGFSSLGWLDEAVALAPDAPELRNNRGTERARLFDAEGALADYHAARALDPCSPLHAMNEARMLWGLGRRREAEGLVTDFERRIAAHEIGENAFLVTLVRASFAFEQGRDDKTDQLLNRALEESDGAPVVVEAVAAVRTAQGRSQDAVRAMRTAALADPSVRTRVGLTLALLENGDLAQAAAQLERAARDQPTEGSLDLHVAMVAAGLGLNEQAEATARRCLARLGLRCARALVVLGDVARARGRGECARGYYQAFLDCPFPVRSRGHQRVDATVRARMASVAGAAGDARVASTAGQ